MILENRDTVGLKKLARRGRGNHTLKIHGRNLHRSDTDSNRLKCRSGAIAAICSIHSSRGRYRNSVPSKHLWRIDRRRQHRFESIGSILTTWPVILSISQIRARIERVNQRSVYTSGVVSLPEQGQ